MAGGAGSRLNPITIATNKHLLPIYDKPLIYYPLTTLMLAGIREIAIVTSPGEISNFSNLLGDGNHFGIEISYIPQKTPKGIADGLILSRQFIENHKVGLILGDNVFHGNGLGRQLAAYKNLVGAQIFAYGVSNPSQFGVVEISESGEILNLEEKPTSPKSSLAVTGLYFYDEFVSSMATNLKPSFRGELEITDLNRLYLEQGNLQVEVLSRGTAWLDTGTFQGLHDAGSYIKIVQERQNSRIGDPLQAALVQGWL